jgi:ribosomal protein L11 methyltransferase
MSDGRRWYSVRIRPRNRTAVAEALFSEGVGGLQELDDELRTHVREDVNIGALEESVRRHDPEATFEYELAEQVDWTEAWKVGVRSHTLGRLTISPPWLASETPAATTVVIDPGTAFGTGEHATTRGVVRLLQRFVREGDRVADLGAGSAVLSIAAVKLGAAWAAAIEIDAEAIDNAEENVAANGVADRVKVIQGDAALLLPLVAPVRVIVANIVPPVLLHLLPVMAEALEPGGVGILSGILLEERDEILAALDAAGWRVAAADSEDIWWTVAAER